MRTLDRHGAACRCLLRLRENEGLPGLSDDTFIARFLPRYPAWQDRPGVTDDAALLDIARDLGLANRIEATRDYDRVLQAHRAGQSVLVVTERVPELREPLAAGRYVLLLVDAQEESFVVWCPYPSGQSEVLPRTVRVWWDRWSATGLLLQRVASQP